MHDAAGILEIQPFAQEIGREQEIRFEGRGRLWSTLGSRREGTQNLLAPRFTGRKAAYVAKHRRDAPMPQSMQQVPNGRLRIRKDDCLRGTGEQPL